MNKKYTILFITVFCLGMLLAGSTYAYWTWNSNTNKRVVFNTAKELEEYIEYNEGSSYFIGNFQPTSSFCQGAHTTISFYKQGEIVDSSLEASINMDVNRIERNISQSDAVHWVITSGDSNITCTSGLTSSGVLNSGTFKGVSSGNTIPLLENQEVTTTEKKFTIWIWIDSSGSNLSSLSGETIDTNVWTQIDMTEGSSVNTGNAG